MKQKTVLLIVLGLVLSLSIQPNHPWDVQMLAAPPPDSEPWGDGKGLTQEQSVAIQKLAFPQRYRSIIERFGYPDARKEQVDYYKLVDGRWVGLAYSKDNVAVRLIYAN